MLPIISKAKWFQFFVWGFGFALSSADAGIEPFRRFGESLKYVEVPAEGENLKLADIVVRVDSDLAEAQRNWWTFGRLEMGIVSDLSFEIRDEGGILPMSFLRKGNLIFMYQQGHPSKPIFFAMMGEREEGGLESGFTGENVHHKLKFAIPGLKVVRETDFKRPIHSILLPDRAERVFETGTTESTLPPDLAVKILLKPFQAQTKVVARSIDESIDIDALSKTPLIDRILYGVQPVFVPALLSLVLSHPEAYLAVSGAVLPASLARFTFSKRAKTEDIHHLQVASKKWTIVTLGTAITCALALRMIVP